MRARLWAAAGAAVCLAGTLLGTATPARAASGLDLLATVPGVTQISGCHSARDDYQHVIAASQDGTITDVYFRAAQGVHQRRLTTIPGLRAMTAYFTPFDGNAHVIAALTDGQIREYWYDPRTLVLHQALLATYPRIISIAGYHTPDHLRHVVAVADSGELLEIYWGNCGGIHLVPRGYVPSAVEVSAYYAVSEHTERVVVRTIEHEGHAGDVHRPDLRDGDPHVLRRRRRRRATPGDGSDRDDRQRRQGMGLPNLSTRPHGGAASRGSCCQECRIG